MRIGYLASHYPAVSHTFLLREVRALRRLGVEVETFSVHRALPGELMGDVDREEAARTFSVLPLRPAEFALAHLVAVLRAPARYVSTLRHAIKRANPGLRGRLWGVFYFAEAIPIWRAAHRSGLRHLHAVFADVATDVALLVTHYGGAEWSWSIAVHGPVEFYDVTFNRLAEKLASARFAIAISDFGRSQLMALGDQERWDDIHVIHCGIEPAAFPVDRLNARRASEEPHVLCVGRLVHLKGQALLIAAIEQLHRRGLDARLTLVGDGPERARLAELADRLEIGDRVVFTGSVGQDRIREIYRSVDAFCLPSMAEGVPVVLMEAMAFEVPVIATRIMGIPELIDDGVSGLLVPPGRVDALVEALSRILSDADMRARLGKAARAKVLEEFDVDSSARRLRSVLEAVLG